MTPTTRWYPFTTVAEKLKASYAESVIDFCAALVFCEWDGTEEKLKETGDTLIEYFWGAKTIVFEGFEDHEINFDTNEFTYNFNSWKEKVNDFVFQLLSRDCRFDRLDETGKGFYTKNDTHVYVK